MTSDTALTTITAFIAYALLVYALGLGFIAIINKRANPMDTFSRHAIAFPVGMGLVLIISLATLISGRPIHWLPGLVVAGILMMIAALRRSIIFDLRGLKNWFRMRPWSKLCWYEWFLLAGIMVQSIYLFFATFWRPVCRNDDWVQWAGNAKYLFYHGLTDQTFFEENLRSNYPLFIMSNEVTFCKLLGRWDDFACKAFLVLLVISFTLFLYRYLRQAQGRTLGLVAAFFFLTLPYCGEVAKDGTGEIPASIYLALTGIFMLAYLRNHKLSTLLLAAFFGGVLCGIKAEGVPALLALSSVFIFLLLKNRRRWVRAGLCIIFAALIFTMPWKYLMDKGECSQSRISFFNDPEAESHADLKWLGKSESYLNISKTFLAYAVPQKRGVAIAGTYFFLALLYWLIKARRDKESINILLMIAAVALVYTFAAYTTRWPSELRRLLTHTIGLAILFIIRQVALATGKIKQDLTDTDDIT